ncbi:MAG TPA: hypothetical protein VND93_12910 [Myxococcales bacterium]|nr:hypothetical protein [Myxococcales bacterium]
MHLLLAAVLAAAAGLPMPPPPAPKPAGLKAIRVAVLDPAVDPGVDARLKAAMGQSLTAEIRKLQKVTAIAADEIQQMVSFQRSRQLMGCSEDTSCMAELVDALAADDLISMRIGLIGQSYTVAVQRLDARRAQVAQSFTRQVPRGSGEELLALVGPMVETLFPERPLAPGKTRGVDKDVARRLNPPPLPRWVFFTTAGVGAAAGAGGGLFGFLASQSYGRYRALADGSTTTVVDAASLDQAKRETQQAALGANAFLIGAGALALAAAFEAAFTDWNDDRARLAVVPAPGGAGVVVRF